MLFSRFPHTYRFSTILSIHTSVSCIFEALFLPSNHSANLLYRNRHLHIAYFRVHLVDHLTSILDIGHFFCLALSQIYTNFNG